MPQKAHFWPCQHPVCRWEQPGSIHKPRAPTPGSQPCRGQDVRLFCALHTPDISSSSQNPPPFCDSISFFACSRMFLMASSEPVSGVLIRGVMLPDQRGMTTDLSPALVLQAPLVCQEVFTATRVQLFLGMLVFKKKTPVPIRCQPLPPAHTSWLGTRGTRCHCHHPEHL